MIYPSIAQLIGGTPLLELRNLENNHHLQARLLAKLEKNNPAGSSKDRVALQIILAGERQGLLRPGGTIIEATSGNTGIALCAIAAARGYGCIIVMPDTMSRERRLLISALGGKLVLTPGQEGMTGAVAKARELQKAIPGSIIAGQFINPANPESHYHSTGPEIWEDTDGNVDIFVAGIGTGGTITGTGGYLREKNPKIRIIGVEPKESPLITKGFSGPHSIQGIGANFIPEILDLSMVDEVVTVATEDAYAAGRQLAREEGVLVGISSGCALHAALELAKKEEHKGKTIVVLLPDSGERYLTTPMYQE